MIHTATKGGTGAGRKPSPADGPRCTNCGGFIAQDAAERGENQCQLCAQGFWSK